VSLLPSLVVTSIMFAGAALLALALAASPALAGSGKGGLDWTYYDGTLNPAEFNTGNGNVVAIYNYETYAPSPNNGGLGFIGMQRCLDCTSSPVADLYTRWQQQGWATVFSLNEPDINGISPSEAASWYIEYINPLSIKKAIPSVTSSTSAGEGLSWAQEFISACAGQCYYDYINLHWYGTSFSEFQSYVEQAHSTFPSNQIVITEFALQAPATADEQLSFLQSAIPFLNDASYVQLYFPFVATSPSLLTANDPGAVTNVGTGSCLYNDDGSISTLGDYFLNN